MVFAVVAEFLGIPPYNTFLDKWTYSQYWLTDFFGFLEDPPCGTPRFVEGWEPITPYPLAVADAQGAIMNQRDLVVFSGFHARWDVTTPKVFSLDLTDGNAEWVEQDDVPFVEGVSHQGIVVVDDHLLYHCGGWVGGDPGPATDRCLIYDHSAPLGSQWTEFDPLPEPSAAGGLVYDEPSNSLIYATGATRIAPGRQEVNDLVESYIYRLSEPALGWVQVGDTYKGNHKSFATAIVDGVPHHFFFGGQKTEGRPNILAVVDEYDTETQTFESKKPMYYSRGHFSSSARGVGCGLMVLGGNSNMFFMKSNTDDVSYYDVPTNSWRSIGTLPEAHNTPVCDILGEYVYCVAGYPFDTKSHKFAYRRKFEIA